MPLLVVVVLLVASALLAMRRGPGFVFAYLYLPALLLVGVTRPISIQPLPDLFSLTAIATGTIVGSMLGGKLPPIRPHWIDALLLSCTFSLGLTSFLTGNSYTLLTYSVTEILRFLTPYAMARAAFFDPLLRRRCALSLCYVGAFFGLAGVIEFRLRPVFVSRFLASLDLSNVESSLVMKRGNYFRAMVSTEHPIDYGNVCMILCGLIVALAVTSGISLRDRRVLVGLGGAAVGVACSMSFSSLFGFAVAIAIYLGLRYVRGTEYLLVPGVVAAMIAGLIATQHMLAIDLDQLRRDTQAKAIETGGSSSVDDSYYVRVLIAQNAYNRVGVNAGLFGFGDQSVSKADVNLLSVDNSYMLFLLKRGWVGLSLRLLLGVAIAALGTQLLARARGEAARAPPAAVVAVLLGTMVSMFTVWFGFIYAVLWTLTLGTAVSMRQTLAARRTAEVFAQPAGRGFPVGPTPFAPARSPVGGAAAARPLSF